MIIMRSVLKELKLENGKTPYREWLSTLDVKTRARIEVRIFRVEMGNLGDNEPVGSGVREFRFHFGAGYRVYYGKDGTKIILLLCAGDKKTQKKDIKKAKELWAAYTSGGEI